MTPLLWLLYITSPIPVLVLYGDPTPPLTQLVHTIFINVGEDGMGHGSPRPPSLKMAISHGNMLLKRVFKVSVLFNDTAPGRSGAHPAWTWLMLGITKVDTGRAALVISVGCYHKRMSDVLVKWKELRATAKTTRIWGSTSTFGDVAVICGVPASLIFLQTSYSSPFRWG